ncbi:MAG TPA: response regulator transcription factor [Solirubrobacteraceae bacterium]
MPATALVVDDHASFRRSARRLLEAAGYEVVGEAGDGSAALAAVRTLAPDLVLLDVVLPTRTASPSPRCWPESAGPRRWS